MEFKKPTKYREGRPALNVPERSKPVPIPPQPKHPAPVPEKKKGDAHVKSFKKRPTKKVAIIGGSILVLLIGLLIFRPFGPANDATENSSASTSKATDKPTYTTVVPNGKSVDELGGWKRVSPPKSEPVYAYADSIDGVSISVSQQPLPKSFETNPEVQVADLAKKFNATNKLAAGNIPVYIGTSAKGPQSVILTKNDVLILIKSQKKINDKSWAKYAESLNSPTSF